VRAAFLFFSIPALVAAAELTIDHVTVAGKDVKNMQAKLESAGIRSEYGGPHSNGATEMALTSFPDGSYLELIALQANADPSVVQRQPWAKQMLENAGPCAWAVRVKDISAEVGRLQSSGVTVAQPEKSGRVRPDGTKLEWETAQVGAEPRGTFFPFLIRDFTPRQKRAFPNGKPTSKDFGGVSRVVIAVRDLDEAVKRYRAAYGLRPAIRQVDEKFGAQLALLGGTPVVLASPLTPNSWVSGRLQKFGEGPCAFILTAKKAGKFKAASTSRWFGVDISWFDPDQLGWALGFE
jgi:hypothetical protein